MGDLHLELPNRSKTMKVTFKNAVHSPTMAFTLLSISKLNTSGQKVTFYKQMCMIQDPKGNTIARIPHLQGLYKVLMQNKDKNGLHANIAAEKMKRNANMYRTCSSIAHPIRFTKVFVGRGYETHYMVTKPYTCMSVKWQNTIQSNK